MRLGSLLMALAAQSLLGCGGSQPAVGSSVGQREVEASGAVVSPTTGAGGDERAAVEADAGAEAGVQAPPAPLDPALLKALVAKSGEPLATDNPLHVHFDVLPRPAGQLWLFSVINRGTEAARILLDPRRLTLSLERPEDPEKPRPKWQKKPAPTLCKLPEAFLFAAPAERETPFVLEPGEGLVQTFDPRLYCISGQGESLLSQGLSVTPRLGFSPKPARVVWRGGARQEIPSLQEAPFVAVRALVSPAGAEPVPEVAPDTDSRVKELTANSFVLDAEIAGPSVPPELDQPLELQLLRGSDAANERTATVQLQLKSRTAKNTVYFRRELVSFEVHGPDGVRRCDPQPDDRSPDRQAYSGLKLGGVVGAVSLLSELCPRFTFGRPGLYLVSARFDSVRDGAEFGLRAFTGRLESRRQALVRIRSGELPALPLPEPVRVRVGE